MSAQRSTTAVGTKSWIVLIVSLAMVAPVFAQSELFRDQMTNAAAWGTNATSDTQATFNYDYSNDGIPEAPHGRVGDSPMRGLKLEANLSSGTLQTLTAYPLGKNFTGVHQLRFDAWMNYDLQEALGAANGTTEFLGGGVGYDNVTSDVASGAQAITTGDGGSANDWRAFKSPPQFFVPAAAMAGGSRQNSVAYYTDFLPGVVPPAEQGQPDQAGIAGAPGFQWITWQFTSINLPGKKVVNVDIEKPTGERLAIVKLDCANTADGSSGCTSEGNISVFYADFFTSVTARPDLTFGLVDNVQVTRILGGDYNNDGSVDAADYTLWRDNVGAPAGSLPNDLDGGVIGQAQYDTWKANFGQVLAGSGAASLSSGSVPEPAAAITAGMAVLALLAGGQRNRGRHERRGWKFHCAMLLHGIRQSAAQ